MESTDLSTFARSPAMLRGKCRMILNRDSRTGGAARLPSCLTECQSIETIPAALHLRRRCYAIPYCDAAEYHCYQPLVILVPGLSIALNCPCRTATEQPYSY